MANVTVIGGQWGDEGKGKIVDWLSARADVIVRFQGGHNAGHTLVIDGAVYKLSLLPSGVIRPGKLSIIGTGVVIDPWALLAEIDQLGERGVHVTSENLLVADNAALILPVHGALDRAREGSRDQVHIGTTGRGIGPAYEDKVARRAIRTIDLDDPPVLKRKVETIIASANAQFRALGAAEANTEETVASLLTLAPRILPFVGVAWQRLNQLQRTGHRILFEGAQGVMLDIDHGTYPYVTSSNTVASQAATGSGVGPHGTGYILGIVKAYTTRVGSGPFPTEDTGMDGQQLGERGHEFGTVTGRRRRCGWFDAVMVRQAMITAGVDGIALTKLDVLDGLKQVPVCTGYRWRGSVLDYYPAGETQRSEIEPVWEMHDGWSETTRGARSWNDLPAAAVKYVRRIEELVGVPVTLLSTSPERDDTILVRDPFAG